MTEFNVPTINEVSDKNRAILEGLGKQIGFVPNLYATMAHSDNALESYINLSKSQAKGSLSAKEREAINLVVAQVNGCRYCQSAHTELAKLNGFTVDETIKLRQGESDDPKLNALVRLAKEIVVGKGQINEKTLEIFFAEGYDKGGLIDVILAIIGITFTNYVNNITHIPIDFPLAEDLSQEATA